MANTTTSANMLLPIPVVGVDPGPQYGTDVNSCLTIIDGHNHTPGLGVAIPTDGLNINADLTFNDVNAISLRSVRFQTQGSPLSGPSDLGCLYESGVDLYYNDGSGNQVRITTGGALAGTPGSISGLAPPASASYVSLSSTFVWQSAALTPANMDFASAILRNLTASSKGLTLSPPNAMAADYTITLPALPVGQTKFVSMDTSGNMAAVWAIDGTTLVNTSNVISVNPANIPGTMFSADFEINGNYGGLTTPALQLDGIRFFNFNATILNAWAWIRSAGGAGTTTLDIKYASAPGGSYATIFSTKPAFTTTAAAGAYVDSAGVVSPPTGTTAGVLSTTTVVAGGSLKFDLTSVMTSSPDSCGVTVIFKQR